MTRSKHTNFYKFSSPDIHIQYFIPKSFLFHAIEEFNIKLGISYISADTLHYLYLFYPVFGCAKAITFDVYENTYNMVSRGKGNT